MSVLEPQCQNLSVYLGEPSPEWLTTEFGLSLFASTPAVAIPAYQRFIANTLHLPLIEPSNNAHADDPRVLGADSFVANLPPPVFKPRRRITLAQLAHDICARHQVALDAVVSQRRHRHLTAIRVKIANAAIEGRVATLHDLAQFFGRDDSSLCKLLTRHLSPICQD